MLYAQILALLIAIPLGVLAAYRANTRTDRSINTTAFALLAIPSFVLALVLVVLRGRAVATRHTRARPDPGERVRAGLARSALRPSRRRDIGNHFGTCSCRRSRSPSGQVAVYMRLLRSDMIATLQENFITMATAKGVSNRRILWRHALRPSSLTLLTVAGLNVGTLIGGAVVVEVIFGMPGMGTKIYQAISPASTSSCRATSSSSPSSSC